MSERMRAALLVWMAWTAVALLFMLSVMLPSPAAADTREWLRATAWQLVSWWTWALMTPVVGAVAARALTLSSPWKLAAVHISAGAVVSGLCTTLQGALRWVAFGGVRVRYDIAGASSPPPADEWALNLVVYAMVVGGFYVLRAGRLEAQLARSRLDALAARLRPHFLFNALNTISALVLENPKAANRMIAELAELLRQAFHRGDDTEVPLEQELRLLQAYVAIEEQRFGDRLGVTFRCDPAVERALVPALLLQPLVENAVAHGLAERDSHGTVRVEVDATAVANRLRLAVRDNGPGFRGAGNAHGVGLAGTRARLADRYGSAQRLDVADAPGGQGGAVVTIEIPLETDARAGG